MIDRTTHLTDVVESYKKTESEIISKIYSEENGRYFFIPSLEGNAKIYALEAVYIEKNFGYAKQCFYNAARIDVYMSEKYDWRVIDSGIFPISYALLSDNAALIQRYAALKNKVNDTTSIGFQLPNAVQNILLGQWDKLDVNIRNLERFVKFPKLKWYAASVEVFKGFRAADKTAIEAGLQEMIKTHSKRNREELIPKFLSVDTAGYCKLAWRLGYEIDLKSELVPIELMPIKPLDHYEEYDFLKD